jgi:hypothetical protein
MLTSLPSSLIHPQPIKPPPAVFIPFLAAKPVSPNKGLFIQSDICIYTISNLHANVHLQLGLPVYTLSFSVVKLTATSKDEIGTAKFSVTFEELENFHQKLAALSPNAPVFPESKWLSFSVRLEILRQRQALIKDYFAQVLSCREFLLSPTLHRSLGVPYCVSEALISLGKQM